MDLEFRVQTNQSKLSIYWNDILVYTGEHHTKQLNINAQEGWNQLVIECEKLDYYKNFGDLTVESLKINHTDTWPVDAGIDQIFIPFSLLHGYCYTESGQSYLAYDNKLFTNSYQRLYFKIQDSKIVDYYHDRNPSDGFYNQIVFDNFARRYGFYWSDIYGKHIHRHMMNDHFMMIVDSDDVSTYGTKWNGVRFEYTDTALAEDLQRTDSDPAFPFGPTLYQSEQGLGFTTWWIPHVFGSYLYKSIPPDLVAPLLVRV